MSGQAGKLLRIYVNELDQYEGKPLYEAIVARCRELRLAGVTVFRALEGYGETTELHRPRAFHSDLPIAITIVESAEKARQVIPVLQGMMNGGLIALTDVEVIAVRNGRVVRWRDD